MKTNQIYFHSSETMPEIESESIRLVIASPPFTNSSDGKSLDKADYCAFLDTVFNECYRTLLPGGIFVSLNTDLKDHASYNRGDMSFEGTVWLKHAKIRAIADNIGFRQFDYKVWVKSFKQDMYRFKFSHILFFKKPGAKRFRHHPQKHTKDFAPSVWHLQDSMQRRDSEKFKFPDAFHPDISRRCIREFTKKGDLVLSPFTGSGTILATAHELNRKWLGYEINADLELLIQESIHGPRPKIYNS